MNAPHTPEHIEHLPTTGLVPYARNSRTHSAEQVAQIVASIREFGFTNPILVDEASGIIAGHGRVMAAREIGMETVPCIRLAHLTEAQRRAYVIADNKLALNAGWDQSLLSQELEALRDLDFDVSLIGFSDDELGDLLDLAPEEREGNDPDAIPHTEKHDTSRRGDLWRLGPHHLLCGDSTLAESYNVLLQGGAADVVWTDPPYNVGYEGVAGKIMNDDMTAGAFLEFLQTVMRHLAGSLKRGGAIYVAHADAGETGVSFRRAFLGAGLKLAQCLVWRKDHFVLGRSDYQWIHEPILYGWKPGAAHRWYGGRKQVTVTELGSTGSPFIKRDDGRWQITLGEQTMIVDGEATVDWIEHSLMKELKPNKSALHPTTKPVALIERMIRNNAVPGAIVLDAFGGSGSTLIACERMGMNARVIEMDPKFVDVIVRRWQQYTGKQATLEGDGRTFDQIAERGR